MISSTSQSKERWQFRLEAAYPQRRLPEDGTANGALENRVNERSERRALRENQERAEREKYDDYRKQPELFVLPQEKPDFISH